MTHNYALIFSNNNSTSACNIEPNTKPLRLKCWNVLQSGKTLHTTSFKLKMILFASKLQSLLKVCVSQYSAYYYIYNLIYSFKNNKIAFVKIVFA